MIQQAEAQQRREKARQQRAEAREQREREERLERERREERREQERAHRELQYLTEREQRLEEPILRPTTINIPKMTPNDLDIEAYLASFERAAESNRWPADTWVIHLGPLLIGKTQSAYASV